MTDHTLESHFKVTASCTNADISRDAKIIQEMALAISPLGTPPEAIPPILTYEATRVYLMINAMRLALEREVRESTKIEQIN